MTCGSDGVRSLSPDRSSGMPLLFDWLILSARCLGGAVQRFGILSLATGVGISARDCVTLVSRSNVIFGMGAWHMTCLCADSVLSRAFGRGVGVKTAARGAILGRSLLGKGRVYRRGPQMVHGSPTGGPFWMCIAQ